jgi:hypothetical protein
LHFFPVAVRSSLPFAFERKIRWIAPHPLAGCGFT